MRVVFMGTPDFSVGVLKELINNHEVLAVVTQPDKPKGRGKAVQYTPVKEEALKHGIKVIQPDKIKEKEVVEELRSFGADIFVVAAFGQLLSKEILDMPKYGCINVHASLLPKYRGASPIQWAVINGDEVSGVTIMQMDVGMDTGDMIIKKEVVLDKEETGGSLFDKLSEAGAKLCIEAMELIESGSAVLRKQDDSLATHTKMIDKSLGLIDWNKTAVEIERLIRGLNPWPSAFTYFNGKTVKIWGADVITDISADKLPGEILEVTKDSIFVNTKENVLRIKELQLEGKKRLKTAEFLRGYKMVAGDKFSNTK